MLLNPSLVWDSLLTVLQLPALLLHKPSSPSVHFLTFSNISCILLYSHMTYLFTFFARPWFPMWFFIQLCLTHSFLIITRSPTIHYLCELFYRQYPPLYFHFTYKFPFSKYIPLIACFWFPGFYMKSKLYTKIKYLKLESTHERGHEPFLLFPSLYSFNFPVLTICLQMPWLHVSLQFHSISLYILLYFHYAFISQKTIWENWIHNYCEYTCTEQR